MNKLIVLSGVPGSGKSYFSSTLKKSKKSHLYIVSSDELRTQICGNQADMSKDDLVWKMYYELAKVYSLDKDGFVILDATHSTTKFRVDSLKDIKTLYNEVDLVTFNLDRQKVINQNLQREFPIPTDALERLMNFFELPGEIEKEFYDKIYIISSNDIAQTVFDILKK